MAYRADYQQSALITKQALDAPAWSFGPGAILIAVLGGIAAGDLDRTRYHVANSKDQYGDVIAAATPASTKGPERQSMVVTNLTPTGAMSTNSPLRILKPTGGQE